MAYWNKDKYGNEYTVVGCKNNSNGYPVGYFEIGNQLYKVEPSKSSKSGVDEWVKVTKTKKWK